MHYVDWSGDQYGHLLFDPFEDHNFIHERTHSLCPEMRKALQGVYLIAEQKKRIEESTKVCKVNVSITIALYFRMWACGHVGFAVPCAINALDIVCLYMCSYHKYNAYIELYTLKVTYVRVVITLTMCGSDVSEFQCTLHACTHAVPTCDLVT